MILLGILRFFPHNKYEVRVNVTNFITCAENQFSTKVKIIHTDNGIEFFMHDFFASKGSIHQTTSIETSEQNGIVKRKHQYLLNVTRTLLFQSSLPAVFWYFVVQHIAFLINCMPTPLLNNVTTYEKLYKSCVIFLIYVFLDVCATFLPFLLIEKKLDNHVVPDVFLGFKLNTKGFLFLNLKSHKIDLSINVIFHENCFPYYTKYVQNNDSNSLSLCPDL